MKPKKGYRRKQGHRQQYTRIQIEKIDAKVAAQRLPGRCVNRNDLQA